MLYESYCLVLALFHLMSPEKHFKFSSFSTDTCWLETRRQTRTLKPPGEVHLGTNSSDVFVTITIVFTLHRKPEPWTRTRGQGDSPLGGRDGWVGRQTDRQVEAYRGQTDRGGQGQVHHTVNMMGTTPLWAPFVIVVPPQNQLLF